MTFKGELRPYQQAASSLITTREKALLALDLGTGKTVVSIHAIEELRDRGILDCALLIMSSSLTVQWAERIKQFTDSSVIVIDGSSSVKKRLKLFEEVLAQPPAYLVMGIRQVVSDLTFIRKLDPTLVLVDEVTSIKNFGTQQTKAIKKLKSRFRIGLTAEPIENGKAEELFSIMEWIDPSVFGHWSSFDKDHIIRSTDNFPVGYKNVPELNEKLLTACIVKRRDDPDVAAFMPTVEEYNLYVEMDDETRHTYNGIVRELLASLHSAGPRASQDLADYYAGRKSSNSGEDLGPIASRILGANLLLDSPALLRESGERYNDPEDPRGSKYASSLLGAGRLPPRGFLGAKVEAAQELLTEYLEADPEHKIIVFARFKGVLSILANSLPYKHVLFTGDMNGKQRGEAIERFTNAPDVRLFLSSDAGGYGVDLGCASHLVNYDLPNSSGVFKQRNGRHVRTNSKFRRVFIDNLIVSGSIEEYQLSRLDYKSRVSAGALTGLSDVDGRVTNEAKSLTRLLEEYLETQ